MRLNEVKLANAAALTTFILYALCALFTALLPGAAMTIFAGVAHIPNLVSSLGPAQVTFQGFFLGLIPLLAYSYLAAYLVAVLYNRSAQPGA